MQWEKLERSFQACEALLRRLRPVDSFNLLLFNSELSSFSPAPATATTANVEQALAFIRNSRIRGGTDLQRALRTALAQSAKGGGEPYIVLLSDGGSTDGIVQNGKLAAWYTAEWSKLPDARRPHTLVFGVGDDANEPLLKMLAANRGLMEWVRSTEPIEFKLNAFLSKIGRDPVKGLALTASPASNFDLVYAMEDVRFPGSMATWTGRYKQPLAAATFEVKGTRMTAHSPAASTERGPPAAAAVVGQGARRRARSKRSSAKARTATASTKSSGSRRNTNSSHRTLRSWLRRALCCAPA